MPQPQLQQKEEFVPPHHCSNTKSDIKELAMHCKTFQGADTARSVIQLSTTMVLFVMTMALMVYSLSISYWITALLIAPAAGLLTRIFIFQHDCGHRSFFKSKKANDWTGRALSLLTFTPYDFWRRSHNMHHAMSGNLDHRSIGGIDTVTIREYESFSEKKQFFYRLYRNPIMLLILGTPFYTIILQRFSLTQSTGFYDDYRTLKKDSVSKSVLLTNISLFVFYAACAYLIGLKPLLLVFSPVLIVTTWIGGWLFYIQHQFEDSYWERHEQWNRQEGALMGSSYYELPKILQWFTGNIGFHHIHHLCSSIPNYKLQECMESKPELEDINKITLLESFKCARLKLWDEDKKQMVTI